MTSTPNVPPFSMPFLCICMDGFDPEIDGVPVALLTVISDHDTSPVHYQPVKISVIIESDAVVSLPRFGDAFLVMFGLIYVLHLSYPKALTNTFEFIQKILLSLENGKLSPRLQTFKNELLLCEVSLVNYYWFSNPMIRT